MILRAVFAALLAHAGTAGAEVPLVTFEFPGETFIVPAGEPVEAETTLDQYGTATLSVRLGKSAKAGFAAFSARHVDETGTLSICDEELSKPRLITPIDSGLFWISGQTPLDATRLANRLAAGRCDLASGG